MFSNNTAEQQTQKAQAVGHGLQFRFHEWKELILHWDDQTIYTTSAKFSDHRNLTQAFHNSRQAYAEFLNFRQTYALNRGRKGAITLTEGMPFQPIGWQAFALIGGKLIFQITHLLVKCPPL